MATENQTTGFRTAAFGGFSKTDVTQYLDGIHKRHREEYEACAKEAERFLAERDDAVRRAAAQEATIADMSAEMTRLYNKGEESSRIDTVNRALSDQADNFRESIQHLEAEVTRLQAENKQLAETAREYDGLRLHIADIELSAHRRADATLHDARMRETMLKSRVDALLKENRAQLDLLRTRSLAATEEAIRGIETLRSAAEGVYSIFDETVNGFDALRAEVDGDMA
jgi:chromosome segregation ATPase